MHNPTEVLALIIAEKQEEINKLKADLATAESKSERYWRWWNDTDKQNEQLKGRLAELEAELKKADPLRNFVQLHKDA